MTLRQRAATGDDQAEPSASRETRNTTMAPRREARLRVVLGGAHSCHPDAEKQRRSATEGDTATGTAEAVLTGCVTLVVDDEPMILEILTEYCGSLGMEVYEAADGEGALKQLKARPGIEVLVTDVRMPGLDGPALVKRALALRPEIKVIYVTGYTTYGGSAWPTLRKPFDLDKLKEALRQALAQNEPNSE
jgi:CheY-like chemotaxis protein